MSLALSAIRDCFEGVIPGSIATLGADGMPNISYLSQVFYVDEAHVALSNQFFSKTAENMRRTGQATAMVVDGRNGAQYVLDLAYSRSQTDGDLFARMSAHLRALSSQHGLDPVMRLASAEVYRVSAIHPVPGTAMNAVQPPPRGRSPLLAAAEAVRALAAAGDADSLIDTALDQLVETFGFGHAMLLTPDPATGRLVTLASRGYDTVGVGSEVAPGQGVIGIAAETGQPLRISEMSRGRRFVEAVRNSTTEAPEREIPLPGLRDPQSQIAAPLIARGRLMGVLFAEDAARFRFDWEDEEALGLVAGQLASALRLAEVEAPAAPATPTRTQAKALGAGPVFRVRYYPFDDSLFVDDAYLIKGVPGRLLFHFLKAHAEDGRRDFTNREIRLDASLRLPGVKDNLETRLILLRRRLEEKAAPVQLSRPERGRIRLELSGRPELEVVTGR